jgi:serine/threonine protein kinase
VEEAGSVGVVTPLEAGSTFAGKYLIDGVLGKGGMGAVSLATNQAIGRRVAIKVLVVNLSDREDVKQRFAAIRRGRRSGRRLAGDSVRYARVQTDGGARLFEERLLTPPLCDHSVSNRGSWLGIGEDDAVSGSSTGASARCSSPRPKTPPGSSWCGARAPP